MKKPKTVCAAPWMNIVRPAFVGVLLMYVGVMSANAQDLRPNSKSTDQKASAPGASAATRAAIGDAQKKINAKKYAEAIASLVILRKKAHIAPADVQALDFALASANYMWGQSFYSKENYMAAVKYMNLALEIDQKYPARLSHVSLDLYILGRAYDDSGNPETAIVDLTKALSIDEGTNDKIGQASVLSCLGTAYADIGQNEKAIRYFEQELSIAKQIKNKIEEANALEKLGLSYCNLNEYEKSLRFSEGALALFNQGKIKSGEADVLLNIGITYAFLSQSSKAVVYFEKARAIFQQTKGQDQLAWTLSYLGGAYDALHQFNKAIECTQQALPIMQRLHDRSGEAAVLQNLGDTYDDLHQYEKSIAYYSRAITIYQQSNDLGNQEKVMTDLSGAYLDAGQYESAIALSGKALPIQSQVKDRDAESKALNTLERAWSAPQYEKRNVGAAIFFGKQGIDLIQSIRTGIQNMNKETQKEYVTGNEEIYRRLADLLIEQDRLPEAMQVLDLLKEEEYLNFSRPTPDAPNASDLLEKTVDLSPREKHWSSELAIASDALARDAVSRSEETNPSQAAASLAKKDNDKAAYFATLKSLAADFPQQPDPVQDRVSTTSNVRDLQSALRGVGAGNVVLYTLITGKTLRLMLVTADKIVAREAPSGDIPSGNINDLGRKIAAFRSVLQSPKRDPRPLGKAIYDMLIAPVQADLEAAHATTLFVSLDGNLRYIPLAALSPDGKHYLVESYRTALYTPAAIASLTRAPNPDWTALAMGVSQPPPGFAPLPAVPDELKAVSRTDTETGPDSGMFPGVRLLDRAFTKAAMVSALGKGYPLVHIASHFVFTGDETTSFLLLGDGTHLTLSDLKALPDNVFAGVNLLTLSACETGTGNMGVVSDSSEKSGSDGGKAGASGDGSANSSRDVENVAVLAQRKGADAVLASLWSVSDESTSVLMRTFYRDRQGSGTGKYGSAGESKTEALRQAQIALLTGTAKSLPSALVAKRSDLLNPVPLSTPADAPAFTPDTKAPWAHPFYWAPFILIGNAK